MKKNYLKWFLIVLVTLPYSGYGQQLQTGDPSQMNIGNYIGEKIESCIDKQIKTADIPDLVNPFYDRTETFRWQTEFWGKWMLSAVAAYRYTGDAELKEKMQTAVKGLIASQTPDGYIGNYAPDAQLEQWDVWGRKYSMLGLLAWYDLTKDKKALEASRKMADHLMTQVGPGKKNISEIGNYRGMAASSILEPIVYLYERTKNKKYLDFAEYIVADWETPHGSRLLSKAEAGEPVADRFPHPVKQGEIWWGHSNGQKAYEMMSCYEGLLELYKVTGNTRYLSAVEKTVNSIIDDEINIAGSGSAFECWYHGKPQQTRPTYHTMETCVTMTWMKLCQTLLTVTGNSTYADQLEKTAYNAMLASMKDDASQIAKYSPLEGQRHSGEFQCDMHINCCIANGPRAFLLLPQFGVMQSPDNNIYINLYNDFTTNVAIGKKQQIEIAQNTNYPVDGETTIRITPSTPQNFAVALRIPEWSKQYTVKVNGEAVTGNSSNGYLQINRLWQKGDEITLTLDVRGRIKRLNDHFAIEKGPVVLARDTRFKDGFVDETAAIPDQTQSINLVPTSVREQHEYIELIPSKNLPQGIWMAFTTPLVLSTDLEGEAQRARQVHFCDFSSAGNTWSPDVRYRVWIPETLNIMETQYYPY